MDRLDELLAGRSPADLLSETRAYSDGLRRELQARLAYCTVQLSERARERDRILKALYALTAD